MSASAISSDGAATKGAASTRTGSPVRATVRLLFLCIAVSVAHGGGRSRDSIDVARAASEFLHRAFGITPPPMRKLWLTRAMRRDVEAILGRPYRPLRVPYWTGAGRCVLVLDGIGKDSPITVGVIVEKERVAEMRVLVFRESRGHEVKRPSFLAQFVGVRLAGDHRLDREVDGITGATLSVRAVARQARMALYLSGFVEE